MDNNAVGEIWRFTDEMLTKVCLSYKGPCAVPHNALSLKDLLQRSSSFSYCMCVFVSIYRSAVTLPALHISLVHS